MVNTENILWSSGEWVVFCLRRIPCHFLAAHLFDTREGGMGFQEVGDKIADGLGRQKLYNV